MERRKALLSVLAWIPLRTMEEGGEGGSKPSLKGAAGVGASSTGPVIGEVLDFRLDAPVYAPKWQITENCRFTNPFVAEEFVDRALPAAELHHQRG